jgi:hypothetical protein
MVHHANLSIPYPFEIRSYTRTQENSNNEFFHVYTCQYIEDFDFENYAHTLDRIIYSQRTCIYTFFKYIETYTYFYIFDAYTATQNYVYFFVASIFL